MHGNYRHHYLLSPTASQQQPLPTTIPPSAAQTGRSARQQQAPSPNTANSNFNGFPTSPTNIKIQHSQILPGNYCSAASKRQPLQPGSNLQELDKQASITLQRPFTNTRYLQHQKADVEKLEQCNAASTAITRQQVVARMATGREQSNCNTTTDSKSQQALEVPDSRQRSTISITRQQQQHQQNHTTTNSTNNQVIQQNLASKSQVNNNYKEVSPNHVNDGASLVNDAHLFQERYASQQRDSHPHQHMFQHQATSNHHHHQQQQQTTTNQFLHQQQLHQNHMQQQLTQGFPHLIDRNPARSPTAATSNATSSSQQFQATSKQHGKSPASLASSAAKTDEMRSQVHVNFNRPVNGTGPDAEEGDSRKKKYLTAKYGQQQMNLIKKRLKIEMWLYEQLQELAKGSKSEAELDEIDIDLDQLLDIDDDGARRRWLQKTLEPFDDLRQDRLNQFINDVLEQSKLL